MRLPNPSPLMRLTLAIASICSLLVLLADGLLGAFPSREQQTLEVRRQWAEGLAVQSAGLLRAAQPEVLRDTLAEAMRRLPAAQAVVLRRADGRVLAHAGDSHVAAAMGQAGDASTAERVVVPLNAEGQRWGRLELAFKPEARAIWWRWLSEPLVATLLLVSIGGTTVIGLYLRRALQHLDPAAVIPERVQGAFDVMHEGVAVLDGKGRVLLTNQAYRQLQPGAAGVATGQMLSAQAWLAPSLPADPAEHPWMKTLDSGQPITGQPLTVPDAQGDEQHLLVNTVPISDPQGRVRGCLASFNDLTPLHRANTRLRKTMRELQAANAEVQRQNEELHRMATRDPLTGCLNRRAFNEAYQVLFDTARRDGLPLSCLILDIDHFKKVNDTHGHGIGDRVIQETARKLSDSARGSDLVCRYGGEEFVLVLPGMDATAALAVAERVRSRIEAECGPAVREVPGMKVTASIGVATLDDGLRQPSQMIDHADQALYEAKRGGRNRVQLAPPFDAPDDAVSDAASAGQAAPAQPA